jgi:nucleotide-binding universal stress UspA family protein
MTAVEMITSGMDERKASNSVNPVKSIVIATDGSDSAIAAFQTASLITARSAATVHVLSVLEPLPTMFTASDGMVLLPPDFYQARNDEQRAIVKEQTAPFDPRGKWTMNLRVGRPADSIVTFAHQTKADLIIVGANKHGMVGRFFGEETAMEVARLSDVPLLVASPSMKRLPKRVVVAMDLEEDGLQCAPEAIEMLADARSISCAHVKPRAEFLGIDWASYDSGYELAMRERFKTLEKELGEVRLRPDLIVLHGDPSRELYDYASHCKAELVVVGIKRRGGRARAVGGRIASNVIRHADCSVLVVPRFVGRPKKIAEAGGSTRVIQESTRWGDALKTFTERNAGRIARLEVDDSELGALVEASNYPFIGADYDHRDGRLTLALGDTASVKRHLTRTIEHPQAVSILTVDGRDTALSVTHGGGQTLLTF